MKKALVNKSEIKVVGLSIRTNNQNEINPETNKISKLAGQFWNENVANKILNRKNPGVTFSIYTNYASNEHGDYTYFIGEEVSDFENVDTDLQTLVIPSAAYQKFTTPIGSMPNVVIQAWQNIWQMSADDFGGQRTYQADFEIYDERAKDFMNTCLDIYIGIKQ